MKKTAFINLLRRKFRDNCPFCDKERERIEQAFDKGEKITIELHPDINPHGALMGWHINLVPKDK